MQASPELCAREILDVVPQVMSAIRAEMRQRRTPDLSVLQFRALLYIRNHPGASLSGVAEHIGLTLPSTSKMVDGLVARELVTRRSSIEDRRRINLDLTDEGRSILSQARKGTLAHLAGRLDSLSVEELGVILRAMQTLRPIFCTG